MADLGGLTTAACLKGLLVAGLTHADIVALIKEKGREVVPLLAEYLQALKDAGLTNEDIVGLVKSEGREAVLEMGAEELRKQDKERKAK